MRDEKLVLAAQAVDASVKTETATTNSRRIVSKRVRNPVTGVEMISAISYEVWIRLIGSGAISTACWMVTSDVPTTCTTRVAMNMPAHIMAKPVHTAAVTDSKG